MAVKKSGLGKGLDSLIPKQSIEKKATKETDGEPIKNEKEVVVKTVVKKEEVKLSLFADDML